jgi:hypothetical protein
MAHGGKRIREGLTMDDFAMVLEVDPRLFRRIRLEQRTVSLRLADHLLTRYGQVVEVNGYGPVMRVEDLWPELSEDA